MCVAVVTALVLISLWYWAKPWWIFGVAVGAAVVQMVAQWATIRTLGSNSRLDLLPIGVWLIVVGASMQFIRPRDQTGIDTIGSIDETSIGATTDPAATTGAGAPEPVSARVSGAS